jgi:hypothetical protein|tara:strand:+ start:171 stop:572 length:402 start_codon:yes stop_codon:yes gene_type:complete
MIHVCAQFSQSIRRPNPDGGVGFTDKSFHEDYTRNSKKAIIRAFAIILLYLIIGTAVFAAWMEDLNAIDAVYNTVANFSTIVGYGDPNPLSKGQRVVGIFFITLGIMIIGGVVLGVLMDACKLLYLMMFVLPH